MVTRQPEVWFVLYTEKYPYLISGPNVQRWNPVPNDRGSISTPILDDERSPSFMIHYFSPLETGFESASGAET